MKLPPVVPEGFLLALPEEERNRLGRAGITQAQAEAKYAKGEERKLQDAIARWLAFEGIYFESDRMDKRTSGKKGRADFRICVPPDGRWLSIEAKAGTRALTPEQAEQADRLRRSGGTFVEVRSLREAIEAVRAAQKK
jgi:hypothetical protein